jgi:hypothetical protein
MLLVLLCCLLLLLLLRQPRPLLRVAGRYSAAEDLINGGMQNPDSDEETDE